MGSIITDYNEELTKGIEVIYDKVKRGMFPLVIRIPTLDELTSNYVLAQASHYHYKKDEGKSPPIPLRDSLALHRCADLVMYEELTWSHPDKMSIVEYPIMSDDQESVRFDRHPLHEDLQYGDRRHMGRRKTHFTDDYGAPQVRNTRIVDPYDVRISQIETLIDLQDALDNAGLTSRQREAIDLVYFEDMTQEQAAEVMGVSQQAVAKLESAALSKILAYMTKN